MKKSFAPYCETLSLDRIRGYLMIKSAKNSLKSRRHSFFVE